MNLGFDHGHDGGGAAAMRLGETESVRAPELARALQSVPLDAKENAMNKDQIKGKAERLKGRAKEVVGVVTGDRVTQVEGAIERGKGALRETLGDVKQGLARKATALETERPIHR